MSLARTSEAALFAAVLACAVQDYLEYYRVINKADTAWNRRSIRAGKDAVSFFESDRLESLIAFYSLQDYINPEYIRRRISALKYHYASHQSPGL